MRPSDYRRTAWLDTVVAKSDKLNNCQKSKLKCEESRYRSLTITMSKLINT